MSYEELTKRSAELRAANIEIERLRAAAHHLLARADSVIRTDAAGNRFRSVFDDDLRQLLHAALEQPSCGSENGMTRQWLGYEEKNQ